MHLRVVCESGDSPDVTGILEAETGVAHLTVTSGASRQPAGDVIEASVAREVAEDILSRLAERGVPRSGQVSLQPFDMMLSDTADAVERAAPGDGADALVWDELLATTGEESRLNGTFLAFLTIACLLAAVGVITNSAITIVGAMVVGPDFGPLAALAVALVGRRRSLAVRAARALGVGFPFAIVVTAVLALLARVTGLFDPGTLTQLTQVSFIYQVGPYSAIVAAISGDWPQCGGAVLQLLVNLTGITLAGTLTLLVRRRDIPHGSGKRGT